MTQAFKPRSRPSGSLLVEVAPNIWTLEGQHDIYYRPPAQPIYPFPHRAVVIRLEDNSLFVISPIKLSADVQAAVDALGAVKYLVAPNHLHHLHLGEWGQTYPEAKLYATPRLPGKRPDLTFDKTLCTNEPEPEWAGQIEQCLFGSGKGFIDEMVFFHRASGTVIFTDLIMDFDPNTFSPIAKITTQWNQMYRHTPRGFQLASAFNRAYLYQALQTVRTWQPDHAIIAHSPWICVDGKDAVADLLNHAFDWLKLRPVAVEASLGIVRLLFILLVLLPIHAVVVLIGDIISPRISRWMGN